eukprot:scaffold3135_cov195-Pinguiococcus_pyrenoidosus.AAC.2
MLGTLFGLKTRAAKWPFWRAFWFESKASEGFDRLRYWTEIGVRYLCPSVSLAASLSALLFLGCD